MRKLFVSFILLFGLFSSVAFAAEATSSKAAKAPVADKTTKVIHISEENLIGKLVAAARASFVEKKYQQAVDLYLSVLSINPSIAPVRYSLAETYMVMGRYKQATYNFKIVLSQKIPPKIAQLIHNHLAYINRQKIWLADFGFDMTPESNINQGSKTENIIVGGLPFKLNKDSMAQSGTNINVRAGVTISPKLGENVYGHFRASASGNYLTHNKQINMNFGTEIGAGLKLGPDKYFAGVAYNKQLFDKKDYFDKVGVWATWDKLVNNKLTWSGRVSASRTNYKQVVGQDYNFSSNQNFSYEVSSKLGFNVAPSISYTNSFNNLNDNVKLGLSAGSRHTLPNSFTISTNLSALYGHYTTENAIFGKKRKDLTVGASLRVANAKFKLFNFAPYVQYRYQRRNSNIDLYDFDNHAVTAGLTTRF